MFKLVATRGDHYGEPQQDKFFRGTSKDVKVFDWLLIGTFQPVTTRDDFGGGGR